MFCALLGHRGERLQDHWSSGYHLKAKFISARSLKLSELKCYLVIF